MEYAGKIALCKKPENIYVGTSEGLGRLRLVRIRYGERVLTPSWASTPPALPILTATARAAPCTAS